eukprot:scaffold301_cov142-Isochrysis_galbana.AAC.1
MSGLRILSIGERWTVEVTKFILGSARGIALFRSAPSSTKLNFSLERRDAASVLTDGGGGGCGHGVAPSAA